MSDPNDVRRANDEAKRLIDKINEANGELDPAYKELQSAIDDYERSGGDVEDLLPAGLGGSGLGMNLFKRGKKGEGFWRSFWNGIKDKICDDKGDDARGFFGDTANVTTSAVITLLVGTVALPYVFIPPIAAIIVSKGIKHWCNEDS